MRRCLSFLVLLLLHASASPSPTRRPCITGAGKAGGGLANTLAFVNAVEDFAMRHNFTFLIPAIALTNHGSKTARDALKALVGTTEITAEDIASCGTFCLKNLECANPDIRRCKIERMHSVASKTLLVDDKEVHALMHTLAARAASDVSAGAAPFSEHCAGIVVVPFPRLVWHFDYTRTQHRLNTNYQRWIVSSGLSSSVASTLASPRRLTVCMHYRLGDVSHLEHDGTRGIAEKRMSPVWLAYTAAMLLRVVDAACMHVLLVTDGTEQQSNETITTVHALLAGAHLTPENELVLWPTHVDIADALHLMAGADVLVAGSSGFSRLAAVLSPHIRFLPALHSHPVTGSGVVVVPPQSEFWAWRSASSTALLHALQEAGSAGVEILLREVIHHQARDLPEWCFKSKA